MKLTAITAALAGTIVLMGCASTDPMSSLRIEPYAGTKQGAQSAAGYYALARYYHGAGRVADAEKAYGDALRLQPGHPGALAGLGMLRSEQGRHVEAVALLRLAAGREPASASLMNNLGYALIAGGEADEAVAELRKALAADPGNVRIRNNLKLAMAVMEKGGAASAGKPDSPAPMPAEPRGPRIGPAAPAAPSQEVRNESGAVVTLASVMQPEVAASDSPVTAVAPVAPATQSSPAIVTATAANTEASVGIASNPSEAEAGMQTRVERTGPAIYTVSYQGNDAGRLALPAPAGASSAPSVAASPEMRRASETAGPAGAAGVAGAATSPAASGAAHVPAPAFVPAKPIDQTQPEALAAADCDTTAAHAGPAMRLEVRNGNGVEGMARMVGRRLAGPEVRVIRLTNQRPFDVATTVVEFAHGMQAEACVLAARYALGAPRENASLPPNTDVRLVLGRDIAAPAQFAAREHAMPALARQDSVR